MKRADQVANADASLDGVTTTPRPIVWIDMLGCGSARRPTIKVPAVRADLAAGSAYFAAMLDGPYRESSQADDGLISVDIPPLRDAIFVVTARPGRRGQGRAPCSAEQLCSVFVRAITRDGRPPEACHVLLMWRALCFVGASPVVMETCARVVHDAMRLAGPCNDHRLGDATFLRAVSVSDRRAKKARIDSHAHKADQGADAGPGDDLGPPSEITMIDDGDDDGGGDDNSATHGRDPLHHVPGHAMANAHDDQEDNERDARDQQGAMCTVSGPATVVETSVMPPFAVVAHLYGLLGGSRPITRQSDQHRRDDHRDNDNNDNGGNDNDSDNDDDGDGTVRDPVYDALLPDPWAHFALDWACTSRARARSYMRFGQQVIKDVRGTVCDMLWCTSPDRSVRALVSMMRDWSAALWPAERTGFLPTGVDAFEHRLAKAVLPGATPARFASAVVDRFPVFGPVFLDPGAEWALGVFDRLPRGVVLAGGCALYALCRSSLTAEHCLRGDDKHTTDRAVEADVDRKDAAGRYVCDASRRTIETCGSVPPGDIDLFIVGPTDSARRAALALALEAVMEAVPDCRAAVGSSVITLWTPRSPTERLQLIFTNKTRAEAVPAGFDMTHLRAACSRDTSVYVSWAALHSLVTGTTCATPGRVVEPERASKALTRGFALARDAHQQHHKAAPCAAAATTDQERTFDYVAYADAEAILAGFAYGQVVNDNYCANLPWAHDRHASGRVVEPLGDARLGLTRVTFSERRHYMAVDRAPMSVVLCPTICSTRPGPSHASKRTMLLVIRPPRAYGNLTRLSMSIVDLRRAEVDLVRRATEVHVGPRHSDTARQQRHWHGKERGLTLADACAAVLAGVSPPWWMSPLTTRGDCVRGADDAHTLNVHVTPETHLTEGVTGRRITPREARDMGGAAVAATVVMGSAVCQESNGGPFFVVATLVSAAFYPPGFVSVLDALTGGCN
nr:hypothetical protein [Pandoravirus massiliensis]